MSLADGSQSPVYKWKLKDAGKAAIKKVPKQRKAPRKHVVDVWVHVLRTICWW